MHVKTAVRRTAAFVTAAALVLQPASVLAQQPAPVRLQVRLTHPGPTISRDIFGQFAEHLGTGIYGGIWVGPNSKIPNVRGIRSDVVAALRAIHVPNVRWPGGCFGDNYHWRNGIGPRVKRAATLNPDWGGVIEPTASALTNISISWVRSARTLSFLRISVPARCRRLPTGSNI